MFRRFANFIAVMALVLAAGCPQTANITVPDVTGMTQAAAEAAIEGAGLSVGNVSQQASSTVPAGQVISQTPAAGATVTASSSVRLVISTGPAASTVPDVVGMTRANAEAAITAAGLIVGAVTEQASATVPAGQVISQDPAAGSPSTAETSVSFVVSTGPQPAVVPDIVGMMRTEAEFSITNAGFTVGTVTQESRNDVPAGQVLSQSPEAGVLATPGVAVDFVVSSGSATVEVPDVEGLTQEEAEAALESAGLLRGTVTQVFSETVPDGEVVSQNPAAGAAVAQGSRVALIVSIGSQPTTIPNVVGMLRADAESALLDANITTITVAEAFDATVPVGQVISQDPAAGESVPRSTPVSLVVSLGPTQVSVPDVVGLTRTNAEVAIAADGLTLGAVTEEFSPIVPAGSVISQNPVAGEMVLEGAAVALLVSAGPDPGQVAEMIGTAGGSISLATTELMVPNGALNESLNLTLEQEREGGQVDLGENEQPASDIHTITQDAGAMVVTASTPFILTLPFDPGDTPPEDISRTTVYLRVTTAAGSFRLMGAVSGNELQVALSALPENADFRTVINTAMRRVASGPADSKALTQNAPWQTTAWECFYDPSRADLRQVVATIQQVSSSGVTDELVEQTVRDNVANLARDATRYYEELGLRQPVFQVIEIDATAYMTANIDNFALDAHLANTYGQLFVEIARMDDAATNPMGSLRAAIAHDLFHASFAGYDIGADATAAALGYEEGLATALGHSYDTGATSVRAAAIHQLNSSIGAGGESAAANADWFAYIAKRFGGEAFTYVGGDGNISPGVSNGLVENLRQAIDGENLTSEAEIAAALRGGMHTALNAQFGQDLGEIYWDFARNRAYERNDESRLRAPDGLLDRYILDETLFDASTIIERTLSSDSESIMVSHEEVTALADIPPLSSRVLVFSANGFSSDLTIGFNTGDWTPDEHGNAVLAKVYKNESDGVELMAGMDTVHVTGFGISEEPSSFNPAIVLVSNVSVDQTYSVIVTATTAPGTPPVGGISGRVTDASNEMALDMVDVTVREDGVFTGDALDTTTTNANGQFTVTELPSGNIELTFEKAGYITTIQSAAVPADITGQIAPTIMVPENDMETGSASGIVIDAVTGEGLDGATLELRPGILLAGDTGFDVVTSTATDATGAYAFTDIAAGVYTVFASAPGYLSGVFTIYVIGGETIAEQDGDLSPNVAAGEIRIILTWGQLPADLDSHLTGPRASGTGRFHVYWISQVEPGHADLDLDDVSSFGPETITIHQLFPGTYRYSVHDFSNRNSTTSTAMSNSGANVRVISDAGVTEFNIAPNTPATLWTVFEIDGETGLIIPKDEYTFTSNPDAVSKGLGWHYGLGSEVPSTFSDLPAKK